MKRLLIAFLALLGVVAQAQPATARALERGEIDRVAAQVVALQVVSAHPAAAVFSVRPAAFSARLTLAAPGLSTFPEAAANTVWIGIDRAAE